MEWSQLYLHTSNRMENLATRVVEVSRAQELARPLSQETVMTLNPGMARWLRFEIAKRTGISFGWEFPLPGKLYARILEGIQPNFESTGRFDENRATWMLDDLLSKLEDQPRFELLRAYSQSGSPSKRYRFAARLARMFDEYLVYRPEQIINWEDAKLPGYDWQGALWKRLARSHYANAPTPPHIARMWRRIQQSDRDLIEPELDCWPERLFIFGVSSLAPIYLDFLDFLSRFRPVHIFLLQPSNLYWGDLKTSKEIAKIVARQPTPRDTDELVPDEWLHNRGNPLLPSLGKQGQIFLDLVIDRNPRQDDFAFEEPPPTTQLGALQNDIFNVLDRSSGESFGPTKPFPPYDETIQIHSAASRRREVEILWDYLIDRLERDPALQASDLLVMAPDIHDYASRIEAVFSQSRAAPVHLPFSIADRSSQTLSPVLSGFSALLEIASARASSKEILSLLERPLFRAAFGFDDNALDSIEFWIRELGITWGWDAEHRKHQGAYPTDRNTWAELENRLAAGLCFGAENYLDEEHRFPPFPEIEGALADIAGRFLECLQLIRRTREDSALTFSLREWRTRLLDLLGALRIDHDDWARDYRSAITLIQEAIPDLDGISAAGSEAYLAVSDAFEQSPSPSGYLSGGITFCSLKPMRAIPAKTICLIGMNFAEFPRKSNRLSFDLIAAKSRRGDRNTREEDRQFFLETLLSARQSLFISYLGRGQSSDDPKEPSAVIAELADYVKSALGQDEGEKLCIEHPRQSHAEAYFRDGPLFTYDPKRLELQKSFQIQSLPPSRPDLSIANAEPDAEATAKKLATYQLEEVIRFYRDPAKFFIEQIARARLARDSDEAQEMDTLEFTGLPRYQFRDFIIRQLRQTPQLAPPRPQELKAEKRLPPGYLEQIFLREELSNATAPAAFLQSRRDKGPIHATPTRVRLEGAVLLGTLETHAGSMDQSIAMPGAWKGSRYLEIWLRHLTACAWAEQEALPQPSLAAVSLDPKSHPFELAPVEAPLIALQQLLSLFDKGSAHPLPLFPVLSRLAYERWIKPPKGEADLEEEARTETLAQFLEQKLDLARAAAEDTPPLDFKWTPYDELCFGSDFALPLDYLDAAKSLWKPLQDVFKEIEIHAIS